MKLARLALVLGALSLNALGACSPPPATDNDAGGGGGTDAGGGGTDAARTDAMRTEAGGGGGTDRCSAGEDNASSTVGCNGGFVMGSPAMNAPGGLCTPDMMEEPGPGSCTDRMGVCFGGTAATSRCFPSCTPGSTYVSTGGCPTGFRCFGGMGMGICYRDCNAANACPAGQECDGEGSCIPSEPEM